MGARFRRLLRAALAWDRGRQSRLTTMLDEASADLRAVCRNEEHDIAINGEAWLIRRIGHTFPRAVMFDVGANRGAWAACARREAPESQLHCFELSAPTFEHLRRNPALTHGAVLNPFGLADKAGPVVFNHVPSLDVLSSIHSVVCAQPDMVVPTEGIVQRGDDYCAQRGIGEIHLLKCDVEGGEPEVLAGFGRMLRESRIVAVQFEYGRVNLARRFFLSDFYNLLESHGFTVGKLYPQRVAWKRFELQDEDFVGPNYVAMRRADISACQL